MNIVNRTTRHFSIATETRKSKEGHLIDSYEVAVDNRGFFLTDDHETALAEIIKSFNFTERELNYLIRKIQIKN